MQVDIVLHGETNTRSTALHAALLAPAHARMLGHSTRGRCDPLELQVGAKLHVLVALPSLLRAYCFWLWLSHLPNCSASLLLQLPGWDAATTAVLFPEGPDTPAVGSASCPAFQTLVVLESSWRKARSMLQHPRLAGLPRVQLPPEACRDSGAAVCLGCCWPPSSCG